MRRLVLAVAAAAGLAGTANDAGAALYQWDFYSWTGHKTGYNFVLDVESPGNIEIGQSVDGWEFEAPIVKGILGDLGPTIYSGLYLWTDSEGKVRDFASYYDDGSYAYVFYTNSRGRFDLDENYISQKGYWVLEGADATSPYPPPPPPVPGVPIPAAGLMLPAALAGLAWMRRRERA